MALSYSEILDYHLLFFLVAGGSWEMIDYPQRTFLSIEFYGNIFIKLLLQPVMLA